VKIGRVEAEAIHMTHSIADALAYAISTPAGVIFHTGDFKIDYTPLEGKPIDFQKLASIGSEGVLLMLCDSTNVERKGYTPSERNVGVTLENIFRKCESSRILVATFSSNVNRVQKIIDTAVMCNRKVAISGRSMINVVGIAIELGYLKVPVGVLVDINKIKNYADSELVIITTGSQGEPMSALSRMASNEHKNVQLKQGDVVILSSSPIPGNEKAVSNIVNKLFAKGVEVIYSDIAETHVSGHACQEELKLIHMLLKPEFFMPVHGEYRHLRAHAQLAADLGMDPQKIFLSDNGASAEGHLDNTVERLGTPWSDPMIPSHTKDGRPVRAGDFPEIAPGPDDTYGSYGPQWAHLSVTPYKRFKSWVHEGGIHTPMILSWGDRIKDKGGFRHGIYSILDFMPTLMEISSGTYPEEIRGMKTMPYEGQSFLKSIDSDDFDPERTLFWEHEGNRAVRKGHWKLVSEFPGTWSSMRPYPENGGWELYNLEEDCTETENLASEHPETVKELAALWDEWARAHNVVDWSLLGE